jgi:CheY-like chemotaxis protein
MSRVLLADDSPHAQRMGERILREEGFEVVTVTDGGTALLRLPDVDPAVVLADVSLPGRSGYEICREIKQHPSLKHVRVILTAGLLEYLDETEAASVGCDGILKKPFEATAVLELVKPLAEAALAERSDSPPAEIHTLVPPSRVLAAGGSAAARAVAAATAPVTELDPERVRAAVTLALDAAMPAIVEELTLHVLSALKTYRS